MKLLIIWKEEHGSKCGKEEMYKKGHTISFKRSKHLPPKNGREINALVEYIPLYTGQC